MFINKKIYLFFQSFLFLVLLGVNSASLILVNEPLFVFLIFILSFLIILYSYHFGTKVLKPEDLSNFSKEDKIEVSKNLTELFGTVILSSLFLNFLGFYSFWSLINNVIPADKIIIIVVITTWIFSTIFEYKLSTVFFLLTFFNPLLINMSENSVIIFAAVIGTIHVTFSIKQSRMLNSDVNEKVFNGRFRVLIFSLLVGCVLIGFFPFMEPGAYNDFLDFSSLSIFLNIIPLIVFIGFLSFQLKWIWIVLSIAVLQLSIGLGLGFADQFTTQNSLNILFLKDELFFNLEKWNQLSFIFKIILDTLFLLMFSFSLFVTQQIMIDNFRFYICLPKPKVSPRYEIPNSMMWFLVDELLFYGHSSNSNRHKVEISTGEVKEIMFQESLCDLLKTINPFNPLNILIISTFAQLMDSPCGFAYISLLKFNWIIYFFIIINFLVIISGKWSDFILNTSIIKFSTTKSKNKNKKIFKK